MCWGSSTPGACLGFASGSQALNDHSLPEGVGTTVPVAGNDRPRSWAVAAHAQEAAPLMRLPLGDRKGRRLHVEIVQETRHALATLLQEVGVDHRGGHIVVPE